MTLIVIDRCGMYADSYARVTGKKEQETAVYNGFTKLFRLPFRVYDGMHHTLPRMAFTGDPLSAIHFLRQVLRDHVDQDSCDLEYLKTLTSFEGRDINRLLQVIFPYTPAESEVSALTITYGYTPVPLVMVHRDPLLVFGGDKPKGYSRGNGEWDTVFRVACQEGLLPGTEYHVLPHQAQGHEAIAQSRILMG